MPPMRVQGPNGVGHPMLPSQSVSREQDEKQSSRGMNWRPYGIAALEGGG